MTTIEITGKQLPSGARECSLARSLARQSGRLQSSINRPLTLVSSLASRLSIHATWAKAPEQNGTQRVATNAPRNSCWKPLLVLNFVRLRQTHFSLARRPLGSSSPSKERPPVSCCSLAARQASRQLARSARLASQWRPISVRKQGSNLTSAEG